MPGMTVEPRKSSTVVPSVCGPSAPATLAAIQGPFDYIVLADTIGVLEDIDGTLRLIHQLCAPSTRLIIAYYSHLWEAVL